MLDTETKRRIDSARDILVGKIPDPKSQVEQITIALIYKFMDDMDKEAVELGGKASFFTGDYEKYAWSKIFDPRLGGYELVALYGDAIEQLNVNPNIPQLFRDIFKNAYLPYRDPETLKLFLKTINEFRYDDSEQLGDAYEYLLSVLGSQGDAGQFRTPRHIIDFIVSVVDPQKGDKILDPACGTAGFLISAYKHIVENSQLTSAERKKLMTDFIGYDISPDMVRLSLVNMFLHKFPTPQIFEYDTLTSEDRWNDYFDVIVANPPFMSPKGGIKPHKRFSVTAKRSEVLFVDYIAEHINPKTGRAGIIVPEGIIFQSANAYKELRKMLVEKHFLYAVVSLPAGVFNPYSGVKTSILFFDKQIAARSDSILFIKIQNDGFALGAQRREIKENDLPKALEDINTFRNTVLSGTDIDSLVLTAQSSVVQKERIAANGEFNLSGERYKTSVARQQKFEYATLGELCNIYQPKTITAKEITKDGSYLVFGANGIIGFYDSYNHEDAEVIITCRGATCGTVNLSLPKSWITGNAMVVSPKDERVTKAYLRYLLSNTDLSSTISGSAQPQITRSSLSPFEIPLPPMEVQKEIVAKIEGWQKIIDGARAVVENYKPEIPIDPTWPVTAFSEAPFEIIDGDRGANYPKKEDFSSDGYCLFLSTKNVRPDGFDFSDIEFISEEKDRLLRKGKLQPGDVVLTTRGTVGNTSLFNRSVPFNHIRINSGMLIFRPDPSNLSASYLFHFFQSENFSTQRDAIVSGSAQPQLPIRSLNNVLVPLPLLEVQQEIVTRIEKEQELINANKELITVFEQKIKDEINKLWEK